MFYQQFFLERNLNNYVSIRGKREKKLFQFFEFLSKSPIFHFSLILNWLKCRNIKKTISGIEHFFCRNYSNDRVLIHDTANIGIIPSKREKNPADQDVSREFVWRLIDC